MKTVFIFVFGLLGWLLATNYQTVYSKMTSFIHPEVEDIELIEDTKQPTTNVQLAELDTNKAVIEPQEKSALEPSDEAIEEASTEKLDGEEIALEVTTNQTIEINDETGVSESDLDEEADDTEIEIAKIDSNAEVATQTNNSQASNSSEATPSNSTTVATNWMQTMHPNMGTPMMNPNMMNPGMYMNPMVMMTPMMMSMMGTMMNPNIYMNPMTMMNHPVNIMTQTQNMNAMMKSMDPEMMFGMFGQPSEAYKNGETPEQLPVITIPGLPTQTYENWPKNTVSPSVSREAKQHAFQTAMAMSPLSMRNMVSMMAEKIPVEEGVSWDDAVEAMKLRANEVNFKFVGSSPLWKQIEAETEQPSAKVEMFRFCDARMARKILDEVPEFIVFLPCKIALMEDAEGKLWVMTLDWDVSWLDYAQNPNSHLSKDIREHAKVIRENIQYIMEGAATGDF